MREAQNQSDRYDVGVCRVRRGTGCSTNRCCGVCNRVYYAYVVSFLRFPLSIEKSRERARWRGGVEVAALRHEQRWALKEYLEAAPRQRDPHSHRRQDAW